MTPAISPFSPQMKIGGYRLIKSLGRGGMGEVWLAHEIRADRRIALKFIYARLLDDPGFKERFLNEAKTLGRLEHDRIVTLLTVVEEGPHLALALRFIQGPGLPDTGMALSDKIDIEGALALDFVLASAKDILPALGFAHSRGVIHRDIKPQNVLLDAESRSFLTDFGIALGDSATRATVVGTRMGTPEYMSPEQIRAPWEISLLNKGSRTDIYSYGVVLYETLCGQVPFSGPTSEDIQRAHCQDSPHSLRELNPNVPAAIAEVVLTCLAKSPDDRPQTCAALLKGLESAVRGQASGRRQREYVPTRVELPLSVAESKNTTEGTDRKTPQPAVAKTSRGLLKLAWPAAGLLAVAGGVTWVMANGGSHTAAPIREKKPESKPITPPRVGDSNKGKGRPVPNQPNKNITNVRLIPNQTLPNQTPPEPGPSSEAEGYATQARSALKSEQPCDGLAPITEALALVPRNSDFLTVRRRVTQACAQNYYEQGIAPYNSGDYCKAEEPFDKAVGLMPGDREYIQKQLSARRGCNALK